MSPSELSADLPAFRTRLAEFAAAPVFTRSDVLSLPCPVPDAAGVYGWWFDALPTTMTVDQCLARDEMTLLYVGISPKRPPAGQPPGKQTLRTRIKYHYTGNAEGSTLRKTLGILLSERLGLELRRVGSGKRMTFGVGEQRLSEWMSEHARVSWLQDPEPWVLEEQLIQALDVPLNLDSNRHNGFHPELTAARAAAVANARALDVVANPGVGGRGASP